MTSALPPRPAGIGVCAALALLDLPASEALPPLECLFTIGAQRGAWQRCWWCHRRRPLSLPRPLPPPPPLLLLILQLLLPAPVPALS